MNHQEYSGIKPALALEGGAMRGAFTIGVLLALQEFYGVKKYSAATGSSAGNFTGAFAITNNLQGLKNLWLEDVAKKEFLDYKPGKLILGKPVMNMDFLLDSVKKRGLTNEQIRNADAELIVTLTDKETGQPFYVSNHGDHNYDMLEVLIMANSMPSVAKHNFSIEGKSYSDGGSLDPFGFGYLKKHGEKLAHGKRIVIATKTPEQAVTKNKVEVPFARAVEFLGRITPGEYVAIKGKHQAYLEQYTEADAAGKSTPSKVFFAHPSHQLSRFDNSRENIENAIKQGYDFLKINTKLFYFLKDSQ